MWEGDIALKASIGYPVQAKASMNCTQADPSKYPKLPTDDCDSPHNRHLHTLCQVAELSVTNSIGK